MTVYHGKLLELKAIKKVSQKIFLQVRLSCKENLDIYLEIDEFTSKNISINIEGNKNYKYRLSFNNYFDTARKQYISTLTRTYLNHSDNISFSCSEEYINMLASIKDIQDISDLDKLSFISRNLESIDGKQEQLELTQDIKSKVNIQKPLRLILLSLGAIFIIFFSYLNIISSNETNIHKKVLAESIKLGNEVNTKEDESLDLTDYILDKDSMSSEDIFLNQSNINFIELDETITYSLPKGNVALTFDDGPSQYTTEIADVLKKYGIGGTFFFTGKNAERYPDSVKYVQSNGYSIGSHSINHLNMPTLSYTDQEIELLQSIELLKKITNVEITLFRPPYGSFNEHIKDLINGNKYKMVLWNNDPKDWKTRNADRILDDIQSSDVSGSIILLHESQAVIDALPNIIEYLQQFDLEIVNLK